MSVNCIRQSGIDIKTQMTLRGRLGGETKVNEATFKTSLKTAAIIAGMSVGFAWTIKQISPHGHGPQGAENKAWFGLACVGAALSSYSLIRNIGNAIREVQD